MNNLWLKKGRESHPSREQKQGHQCRSGGSPLVLSSSLHDETRGVKLLVNHKEDSQSLDLFVRGSPDISVSLFFSILFFFSSFSTSLS